MRFSTAVSKQVTDDTQLPVGRKHVRPERAHTSSHDSRTVEKDSASHERPRWTLSVEVASQALMSYEGRGGEAGDGAAGGSGGAAGGEGGPHEQRRAS